MFQTRSPLYIFISQYTYSTLLVVLPSETCPLLHWEHSPTGYDRPVRVRLYFVVAAVFGFRTCGTGEVGENHIEKGLGVFYWCWTFTGFIGPAGTATVLVRGHGFLRSLFFKKGGARGSWLFG